MKESLPLKEESNKKIKRQSWKQSPDTVKQNILEVAKKEIVTHGLAGSRINVIAEQSETSKRMIYYYFGDKEGLYKAVLESVYHSIREEEKNLKLDHLSPINALEKLVEFTFLHHKNNPDFIRLIMIENIHDCKYLKLSKTIKELNDPAIKRIKDIYEKGVSTGDFRKGIDPLEIHWFISSLSFFNVSNKSSFSVAFDYQIDSNENQESLSIHVKQMLLRFVLNLDIAVNYYKEKQ